MTFGSWIDKIVVLLLTGVLVWFGRKVDTMTDSIVELKTTMAGVIVRLDETRKETDDLRKDFNEHTKEDRQRSFIFGGPIVKPAPKKSYDGH